MAATNRACGRTRENVLHRDIKPGNIFIRREDALAGRPTEPVLIDFGADKQNYLSAHSRSESVFRQGYAPLEQLWATSNQEAGPWTDLYAVGALMWRMVAGGDVLTTNTCASPTSPEGPLFGAHTRVRLRSVPLQ